MPPSTPTRKKAVYLTRDQRIQVQTLHSIGHTYAEIAEHLKITYRQVQTACQDRASYAKETKRPTIDSY